MTYFHFQLLVPQASFTICTTDWPFNNLRHARIVIALRKYFFPIKIQVLSSRNYVTEREGELMRCCDFERFVHGAFSLPYGAGTCIQPRPHSLLSVCEASSDPAQVPATSHGQPSPHSPGWVHSTLLQRQTGLFCQGYSRRKIIFSK